jgi:putative ABC transport system permease protein
MELIAVAWKNLFRNRRRSVLNIIALVVGIVMLIAAIGWIRGYFTTLYGGIMRFDTGEVQVLNPEYLEKERKMPLNLSIKEYQQMQEQLLSLPYIKEAAGRIDYSLSLGNGAKTMPLLGRAVDPDRESRITVIDDHIIEGSWLDADENGVVIGSGVAEKLNVSIGDTVWLRVQDRYNAPNLTAAAVVGIFRLGFPLMDDGMVFTSLQFANELLRMDGAVTRVVITLTDGMRPEKGAELLNRELLNRKLPDRELSAEALQKEALQNVELFSEYAAWPWQRFAESLVKAVQADSGAFYLFMTILTLLIFLNILNSMSMAVRERGGELGTLRAIGMRKKTLRRMLHLESLILSLAASAIGIAAAAGIAWYLQEVGLDFTSALPDDLPVPFGERFRADYRWWDFAAGVLFSCLTAFLGTLLPAMRVSRLSIIQTMRKSV